ncbi:beta-ketoacyl-[acyl-carrier-protein] synthase family protein (plasmid) [Lachnospiraceae bacterium C1.1]|nr:beta-ketoacyl-[acyl-carrier-protein] synthase family protein [Lachnospiraceae bacterium C1.1]
MREKIVVTSMGAVTPIGIGVENYWNNLISGKSGIARIESFNPDEMPVQIAAEIKNFNPEEYMDKKLVRNTDRFSQFAYIAANEALKDGLPVEPERMGIVLGTAMSGITPTAETQEKLTLSTRKMVEPRFVPRILGNMAATQITITHGIKGPSFTVSTACASGGDAISAAARLLLAEEADAVIAVGAESSICPLVMYSLASARALSRENDDPQSACRPFDENHNGFVMGEGGGAIVLMRESDALKKGIKIYAELAGWANTADAYHMTAPSPDGDGAGRCMQAALDKAGMKSEEIGYINAHGTATKEGDKDEASAVSRIFKEHIPYIGSTKGATGHMMGAGGLTEAIASILSINKGVLPPTLNLENPAFELPFVKTEAIKKNITASMSNAFGFGGQNSSLIFKKY